MALRLGCRRGDDGWLVGLVVVVDHIPAYSNLTLYDGCREGVDDPENRPREVDGFDQDGANCGCSLIGSRQVVEPVAVGLMHLCSLINREGLGGGGNTPTRDNRNDDSDDEEKAMHFHFYSPVGSKLSSLSRIEALSF